MIDSTATSELDQNRRSGGKRRQVLYRALRWAAGCLAVLLVAGIVYEQFMRRRVEVLHPPHGQIVDVNGRKVHLLVNGQASELPTVVFESAIGTPGTVAWGEVPAIVSKFARTITYDRSGLLFSGPATRPRSSKQVSRELFELLEEMGEQGPFVLVGHSLGGHHVRVFADKYPALVAGMVLVDVPHEDELEYPKTPGNLLTDPPFWIEPAFRAAAFTGLARLVVGNKSALEAFGPQTVPGLIAEARALDACFEQAAATKGLGNTPLVVITANLPRADYPVVLSEAQRRDLQLQLLDLSSNAKQIIAQHSSHIVQDSQPELIAAAIQEVLHSAANDVPLSNEKGL